MSISVDSIRNADYDQVNKGRAASSDALPCLVCGRAAGKRVRYVRLHDGGALIVTAQEAEHMEPGADMGLYPVGVACLKHHPDLLPYVSE